MHIYRYNLRPPSSWSVITAGDEAHIRGVVWRLHWWFLRMSACTWVCLFIHTWKTLLVLCIIYAYYVIEKLYSGLFIYWHMNKINCTLVFYLYIHESETVLWPFYLFLHEKDKLYSGLLFIHTWIRQLYSGLFIYSHMNKINCTLAFLLFTHESDNCTLASLLFLHESDNCTLGFLLFTHESDNCTLGFLLFTHESDNCTLAFLFIHTWIR